MASSSADLLVSEREGISVAAILLVNGCDNRVWIKNVVQRRGIGIRLAEEGVAKAG